MDRSNYINLKNKKRKAGREKIPATHVMKNYYQDFLKKIQVII